MTGIAAVLSAALVAGGIAAPPAEAADSGSVLVDESFSGASVPDSRWRGLGAACLTSAAKGSSAPSGASNLGGCTATQDTAYLTGKSNGFLQLTDNSGAQTANVLFDRAVPSRAGLDISFYQYQFNTTSTGYGAADGIGFFLTDGAYTLNTPGPTGSDVGGALAYGSIAGQPGLENAVLGVGLDVFGNFSSQPYVGTACTAANQRHAATKNAVVVRDGADADYCIARTGTNGAGFAVAGNQTLITSAPTAGSSDPVNNGKLVRIVISPTTDEAPLPTVTVYLNGTQVLQTTLRAALPPTVKLGFSSSTGGGHQAHLVRTVTVKTVEDLGDISLVKAVDRTDATGTSATSFSEGDRIPYSFLVTNTGAEDLSGIEVNDPRISDISCPATALSPADSFTCTGQYTVTAEDVAAAGTLENTAIAEGVSAASGRVTAESMVTVPLYSGTAEWTKTSSDGGALLAGSEWTLEREATSLSDARTWTIADNGENDADDREGYIRLTGLPGGSYTLSETKAPANFAISAEPRSFTVADADGQRDVALGSVENDPLPNDFELAKTVDPESGTAVDAGSILRYTVTGSNTGQTVLNPVDVVDDLSDVLAHASYNDDAEATVGGEPVEGLALEDDALSWSGSLSPGQVVTITYSVTVDNDAAGEIIENEATGTATPPGGADSLVPPPATVENPVNEPGFSLAKTVDPEDGTAVDAGSTLEYTLTGENTGATALDPVTISDDLSEILNNASLDGDPVVTIDGEPAAAATIDGDTLSWTGSLPVGSIVQITYAVTVNADAAGETLANTVSGSATPPGGETITPPPAGVENPVNIPGFEFSKSVDPETGTTVDPGSVVTYTLTGVNTGATALDPVSISDDLSDVLAHAAFNDDATATIGDTPAGDVTLDGDELSWSGALAVGETVTIEYSVTVDPDAGGETLSNSATGSATPPGGNTITPPPGETTTPVNEPGFEFSKTVDPASGTAVDPGSTLTYTLTGANTGETTLDPVSIADDLSGILANASYNDDVAATIGGEPVEGVSVEDGQLSWTGALAVGETVTITYTVTVNGDAGGETLENTATGSATPPGGSTITPPPSETENPVNEPGFSLSKSVDPESGTAVDPGSTLTYTLTGANTGETALDDVLITDDLTGILAHADLVDDPAAEIGGEPVDGLSVEEGQLTWSGALAVGETVEITFSVTVDAEAGGETLSNSLTGSATPPGGGTITPPPSNVVNPVNEPGFEFSKTVDPASGTSVDPGSIVTYTLTGVNTGETVLDPVDIADDLSDVLSNASFNDDAVATIGGETVSAPSLDGDELSWTGELAVGETVTITYSVTVNGDAGGETLENTATASATPPGGSTITPPPGETQTPVNLPGFSLSKSVDPASGTAVDPGSTLTYTLTGVNTGETALDAVDILDDLSGVLANASFNDDALATIGGEPAADPVLDDETLSWSGALAVGETVEITFSVTVDADAGGQTLANALTGSATPPGGETITPPPSNVVNPVNEPGFEFSKTVDPASGTHVDPGSVLTYTLTGANTGETALDPVEISDDLTGVLSGATFNDDAVATIGGQPAADVSVEDGLLSWSGALAVGETVEITYSVTVNGDAGGTTLDNTATGSATPPGGSTITPPPGETETPVNEPGFEFSKTVDPASGTAVDPGSVLTYTLTGVNTGETALDEVLIEDDLTGILANASFNDDAAATIGGEPVDGVQVDGAALRWTGALAIGETVEITYSVTVHADAGGATLENTAGGSATPPGGNTITPPPSGTENPVNEPGFEFAKTVDPESGTAVDPGSVLTYTLTGVNTGETVLDPVEISDDLTGILANASFNDDAVATIGGQPAGDVAVEDGELSWSGDLAVGETVEITYSVTVGADAGGATLENTAGGSATPPGGNTITPPPGGTENPVNTPGFAFSKSVDPASGTAVDPGSVLTYTLTGANTGETALDPVSITDDLSGVLSNASFNDDAVATIGGETASAPSLDGDELSWTGELAVGETVTITYSVTVNGDAGGSTLGNTAAGSATPPGGSTITPPPSETENPVNLPGFSLWKAVDPESGTAVDPGSTLTYTLTGVNTGETALDEVLIEDDLTGILSGASLDGDAVATIGGEPVDGLSVEDRQLTWSGALAVGGTVEITFSVTVGADAGGQTLANELTGSATPPGGETITPPPSNVVNPVNEPGFEFSKTVDPASGTAVDPGSVLTYTLTGVNTGETALDAVEISDDLTGILANASFNDDAAATISGEPVDGVQVDGTALGWTGALAIGETVEITYSVTVNGDAGGSTLANVATGSATPPGGSTITPPPGETENPVNEPGFEFSKTVDPESGTAVDPGSVLTYTLTGVNTGATALDAVEIADDLSGVLTGATYNGDAVATIGGEPVDGLSVDGTDLAWTGALAVGQTVEITYSATVNADAGGETLSNAASGSATPPGGETITPPPSETENPVRTPGFAFSKSVDPASGTAVDPGSVLTYTLTGVNTGETVLDPVSISDDLSGVLSNASFNDDAVATIGGEPVDGLGIDGDELSWTGALEAGETVVVTYSVTVDSDAGGETLENSATGSATPPGGNTITPPPGETVTPVNEPGFAFSKTVDPESGTAVDPGAVLTYTLTGVNTGETMLDPVEIVDDLSGVLSGASFNDDAVATIGGEPVDGLGIEGDELSWTGALAVGETVEITYSVTVDADAGGETLSNGASGSATPPGGETITPPPSETENPVRTPGFAFSKSVDPASGTSVDPGSVMTYTLTGVNTGETVLDPVEIADDLSGVLSGASFNDDAVATIDGEPVEGVAVDGDELTWTGPLEVGETVVVTYSVTVDSDAGGETLKNSATGTATPPGGETITPPPGETETPVNAPGFSLSKAADPASGTAVDPGQVVTYTITGVNTGDTVLEPVDIVDDLSGVLSGASFNDDAVATIDGEAAAAPTLDGDLLTWTGSLEPGQTVTIAYSATVDADAGGTTIANSVTGSATPPGGDEIVPPTSNVENPVREPGFAFSKTVDPENGTAVDPGSVLSYTLTGVNTGETTLDPVELVDDLSGVLSGASFNDDAVATIDGEAATAPTVDGEVLTWTGALEPGQSVTVTYSVTVAADAGGAALRNSATGSATPPGGDPLTPPPAETENRVNEPGFAFAKTSDPGDGTAVDPGSVVTYTLTGENTGETVLEAVDIADNLSGVLDAASFNDDAVATIGGEPVDGLVVDGADLTWTGSLGVGETVTITYSVTVHDDAGGAELRNVATAHAVAPGDEPIEPPQGETENPVRPPGSLNPTGIEHLPTLGGGAVLLMLVGAAVIGLVERRRRRV